VGDVMIVEVEGVGRLENPVVGEASAGQSHGEPRT